MKAESFTFYLFMTILFAAVGAIVVGAACGIAYAFGAPLTPQKTSLAVQCGAALGGLYLAGRVWTARFTDGAEMARVAGAFLLLLAALSGGVFYTIR